MNIKKMKPTMDWIVKDSNPELRTISSVFELPFTKEDEVSLSKMISYVDASYDDEYDKYDIRPGVAIASNQVGWYKQVIYLHFDDEFGNEIKMCLSNPKITNKSEQMICLQSGEGCLSVPNDHEGITPRHYKITVEAFDLFNNKQIEINAEGLYSIVLQHEIDHLNGHLYYDRFNPIDHKYIDKEWKKL